MTTPDQASFAAAAQNALEQMGVIAELASGYRKKLIELGFGSDAADRMAGDFHAKMINSIPSAGQGVR